ncbi:unnamed protein product [Brassica napus]|uniref:(rape) hypothetical protein n=1 Tax=Brassica napus TaxID=3708 RepID=A0A816UV38_BRANA|nr:unnamed protein product [Brassica napus]
MEPRGDASPKGKVFTGAKNRKLRREDRKTPEPKASHITQRMPSCALDSHLSEGERKSVDRSPLDNVN